MFIKKKIFLISINGVNLKYANFIHIDYGNLH